MKRLAIIAVLAMAGIGQARAADYASEHYNGTGLLKLCASVERYGEGNMRRDWEEDANFYQCLSYISGVLDMFWIADEVWAGPRTFCFPEGITLGQEARILVAYLRAHPEWLHMNGARLVVGALKEAYGCPPTPKTKAPTTEF